MIERKLALAVVFILLGLVMPVVADVELPGVISSHMVLQRDMQVPIWGNAAPGEQVTVLFRGQERTAVAGTNGAWRVHLDPLQAGGPDRMLIKGANEIVLEDVLVGEVWVGSGQSNMDLGVNEARGADPVLAALATNSYPQMRLIVSPGQGWQEATPAHIAPFSALLFGFGVPLQKELDVPVGLIEAAVGASAAVCWISQDAYNTDPGIQAALEHYTAVEYPRRMEEWRQARAIVDAKADKDGQPRPRHPEPPRTAGRFLGRWRQGVHFQYYNAKIKPILTYGIRGVLWDQGESGTGLWGIFDQQTLMGGLIRGWRREWAQDDFPFLYVQKPSGAGCAWDYEDPVTRCALPFAPLPADVPGIHAGRYNADFISIMVHSNTAMVISSDLGPKNHPDNKSGYGARAARVALGNVYMRDVEIYGPMYKSHKVEGSRVIVSFSHAGQGLAWKHGDKLQGFAVADSTQAFHWAEAGIDGDTVVVSSDKVKHPVAVRYGWGATYAWANLFNKDGLPAIPFATDQGE